MILNSKDTEEKSGPRSFDHTLLCKSVFDVGGCLLQLLSYRGSASSALDSKAPSWSVNYNAHQAPRNDAGTGQSNHPRHVNPCNHPPIDRPPSATAEAHANRGARNALRSTDRKR